MFRSDRPVSHPCHLCHHHSGPPRRRLWVPSPRHSSSGLMSAPRRDEAKNYRENGEHATPTGLESSAGMVSASVWCSVTCTWNQSRQSWFSVFGLLIPACSTDRIYGGWMGLVVFGGSNDGSAICGSNSVRSFEKKCHLLVCVNSVLRKSL